MKIILIAVAAVLLIGGGYYWYTENDMKEVNDTEVEEVVTNNNVEEATTISWQFEDAGETDNVPYTNVTVVLNNTPYDMGKFQGSCAEIGASGGVDGKGLLAGELSAVQCWFAGGGDEIGVFAHEDGGYDIMVGALEEPIEGGAGFRGDFEVKHTIEMNNTSSGKLDINVVCESALAYMTFESGEAAAAFVAECKEGKHPEVIERYKADMNLGDGATI